VRRDGRVGVVLQILAYIVIHSSARVKFREMDWISKHARGGGRLRDRIWDSPIREKENKR